jgi:hypothetical protein
MSSRLGGTQVLVCLRTNQIFELNRTGARIWELMTSSASPDAAVSQLLDEFDVTREVAAAELLQLQQRLLDADLIEISNAP